MHVNNIEKNINNISEVDIMYNLEQLKEDMKLDILGAVEKEYSSDICLDVRTMTKHIEALMSIDPENSFEDALVASLNQTTTEAFYAGNNYSRTHIDNIKEACEQNQDKFVRIAVADFLIDNGYKEAKVDLIENMTREKTNYDENSLSEVFKHSLNELGLTEKSCGTRENNEKDITRE